jgi:hypothetical protein
MHRQVLVLRWGLGLGRPKRQRLDGIMLLHRRVVGQLSDGCWSTGKDKEGLDERCPATQNHATHVSLPNHMLKHHIRPKWKNNAPLFSRRSLHQQSKGEEPRYPHKASKTGPQDSQAHGSEINVKTATQQHHNEPTIASLVDYLPLGMQPYGRLVRLDRPWGSMLLLWPCFWSTALAAQPLGSLPDIKLLGLFATGSFVMRGAGCIINDMWDVEFDRNVERTKSRPLASGELSMTQASVFLGGNLLAGLGVLISLPHTEYCVKLGMMAMPLVVAYPLMKRYTHYPQLVLGLTFNWGALMGWAAVHGTLDGGWSAVLPLYASGVAWTLVYDTL